jgi:flagellar FliL protein
MMALIIIGGAAVGGTVAAFVVAPRVIARQVHAAADSTRQADSSEGGGKGGKGGEMKESKIVSFDNLIVNPAGSQGTRFLMSSVALEVDGADAEKRLRDHEIEIRDLITSILESQSMQTLTSPGARDSVKNRVSAAVQPFAGKAAGLRVYLPQFVIQ